jgi:hypothetical protein
MRVKMLCLSIFFHSLSFFFFSSLTYTSYSYLFFLSFFLLLIISFIMFYWILYGAATYIGQPNFSLKIVLAWEYLPLLIERDTIFPNSTLLTPLFKIDSLMNSWKIEHIYFGVVGWNNIFFSAIYGLKIHNLMINQTTIT